MTSALILSRLELGAPARHPPEGPVARLRALVSSSSLTSGRTAFASRPTPWGVGRTLGSHELTLERAGADLPRSVSRILCTIV